MPQVINVAGTESPLFQILQSMGIGLNTYRETKEAKRLRERQEMEDRRRREHEDTVAANAKFQQDVNIADLMRKAAAQTPVENAPTVFADQEGAPPLPDEAAGPLPTEIQVPKRSVSIRTPEGKEIPLAPLQYKQEAEAEHVRLAKQDRELKADVMDVPDVPEWGALAGQKGVRTTTANAYLNALQRRDAAEARRLERQALLDAKQLEVDAKKGEKDNEVSAWVDSLSRGEGTLSDVPATLRNAVRAKGEELKMSFPTRKLGEATIEKLTDTQSLLGRLDKLDSLESGFGLWVQQKTIPDVLTQITGIGEKAKVYSPAYFLFTAEVLKAVQGSRPSDFDMKTYMNNMPKISDPPEVKSKKIAGLRAQLTDTYNKKVKTFQDQGFNTKGFEMAGPAPEEAKPGKASGKAAAKPGTISPAMEALLKKKGY